MAASWTDQDNPPQLPLVGKSGTEVKGVSRGADAAASHADVTCVLAPEWLSAVSKKHGDGVVVSSEAAPSVRAGKGL